MANQEDSACEIPLKRPRLDETDNDDQAVQEVVSKDNENNTPTISTKHLENNTEVTVNSTSTDIKNESVISNNGSSSGEANRTAALDNSDSDNWSDISDLSGMSEDAWKPIAGPISWVQHQMTMGHNPREILQDLVTVDTVIPPDLDDFTMWKIIINLMSEPPKRKKLHHINTLDDVIELLKTCKKIMVLTGAGVSVSCGIPDFRSRNGIYARLAVDFPDLPDPQSMFDIRYFRNDPRPFFKFAKEIYPGQFEPSRCHKFIKLIEQHGKLLRNYTQNIDTLEQVAGITNVLQCHGSFAGATCMMCRHKVTAEDVKGDIFNQIIPTCPVCPPDSPASILKPDIVFFGESLPEEFHRQMADDKDDCDLLIVIGSSLKVRPVALIPNSLPASVPQILINREPLPHMNFDVELLGDCDCIISELCKRLGDGWSQLADSSPPHKQIRRTELATPQSLSQSVSQENTAGCPESKERMSPVKDNQHSSTSQEDSIKENIVKQSSESMHSDLSSENTQKEVSSMCDAENVDRPEANVATCPRAETLSLEEDAKDNGKTESSDPERTCPDSSPTVCSTVSTNHGPGATGTEDGAVVVKAESELTSPSNGCGDDKTLYGALDTSLQEMRRMWHSQEKQSVAKRLKGDQFLFLPPCRYVFQGAEVMSIEDELEESDQDSSVSESRDLHSSQCGDEAGEGTNSLPHQHTDAGDGEGAPDIKMFGGAGISDVVQDTFSLS